ncbi:MAG: c-type cytochrome [Chloroflexota bacterium]
MKTHIMLGTLALGATLATLAFVAVGEQQRMARFTESYHARQIEAGAALFENLCRSCHGPQGRGLPGVAPAINAPDLFNGQRLQALGYAGTVEDFVRGVISAGRPVPSAGASYPARMPTWSQRFGGPLRDDQVEALVAFIMNWKDQVLAGEAATLAAPAGQTVGTDIEVALPAGRADAGAALAESLGCTGCHVLSTVGPAWNPSSTEPGIGERAAARIGQADYAGHATTAQQYLVESTLLPDAYVVPGHAAGVMPPSYGQRLTAQDLADLVAYLLTLR